MKKYKRIHALDSLRAIMMLLGILLHTALTYSSFNHDGWPIHSPDDNHLFFDWLFGIIHIFRMPIFFIVSGYFASFLFYDRSPMQMIKNRFKRIFLPFIIFILLLTPIATIAIKYSKAIFNNNYIIHTSIIEVFGSIKPFMFIPFSTMHLWFLYYLMLFSIISFVVAVLLKKQTVVTDNIIKLYNYTLTSWFLKIGIYSILTFLILFVSNNTWISASTSFTPDIGTFIFYFLFYVFGWILFKTNKLTLYFNTGYISYTVSATICFTISFIYNDYISETWLMLINSLLTWLFIFGIISLFLRYMNSYNFYMRYLLDASYWVYLIHLPLTMLLPGMIHYFNIPVFFKSIMVVLLTFFISLVSYQFIVRKTSISTLLNGKKHL